jgi:nitric oxide dioxygenase
MTLNIAILESTFKLIEPRANEFAASFYHTLFTDCPAALPLFANTDLEKQQKKLIMSLVYVVGNLRYPDNLTKTLKDLGTKHVNYGAIREHYPIVGASLLKTLEAYIGSEWTPEVKLAWTDAYEAISNIMMEGTREHELTQLSQATQPETSEALASQTVGFTWNLQNVLIACGAITVLLGGIWFFSNQSSNRNTNPPSPSSSTKLNVGINFARIAP